MISKPLERYDGRHHYHDVYYNINVTGELLRTYEEQLLHDMMFDYYCD
jgi:hypothetical protein